MTLSVGDYGLGGAYGAYTEIIPGSYSEHIGGMRKTYRAYTEGMPGSYGGYTGVTWEFN